MVSKCRVDLSSSLCKLNCCTDHLSRSVGVFLPSLAGGFSGKVTGNRCCFSLCFANFAFKAKALPHRSHLCALTPLWTSLCLFKLPRWIKAFLHSLHVCVFQWVCKWVIWVKAFPHRLHVYGLNLLCRSWWTLKLPIKRNLLPHWRHRCGLTRLWMRWCLFKLFFWVKVFPHWSHLKGFSPLWMRWCLLRRLWAWNFLSHWSQL